MFNRRTILFGIFMYLGALTAHASGLTDLKDQPFEIKGPAVVNFWATWCAPCIKELPDLEILGQKLGSEATVYLVNFGETTKTIDTFKAKKPELFGEHTVLLKDAKMSGLKAYGLRGVPTTVLINASGETVESIQGMKDWGDEEIVTEIRAKILP
ncbi:MAG: TlpA family protein disulfide reductase [Litorivicinaceae bacterium]